MQLEFENNGKGEKYEVERICDNAVYTKELESGQFFGLYYLISWKGFPEKKNIWEPALAIQYLRKLISTFYKQNPDKPTAISTSVDTTFLTVRPIVKLGDQNNKHK